MRQFLSSLGQVLLPATCLICHRSGDFGVDLCDSCHSCLPPLSSSPLRSAGDVAAQTSICPGCGNRIDHSLNSGMWVDSSGRFWCRDCQLRTPPFRRTVAPWCYAYPVDAMIRALKHRGKRPIARALGGLLGDEVRRVSASDGCQPVHADIVIPVPDHALRRRRRGFNPAADIAQSAAKRLRLPCSPQSARRVVDSGPLANKSRAERAMAIRGAFRVDEGLRGQHVALVDDVLTSGATSGELARECLDTGAASVELWVLARTASA